MAVSAAPSLTDVGGLGLPPVEGRSTRPIAADMAAALGAAAETSSAGAQAGTAPAPIFAGGLPVQPVLPERPEVFLAAPSAQYVTSAYQSVSAQGTTGAAGEVQMPGMPARLASGRLVDFSV